jgi:hypothetical protein
MVRLGLGPYPPPASIPHRAALKRQHSIDVGLSEARAPAVGRQLRRSDRSGLQAKSGRVSGNAEALRLKPERICFVAAHNHDLAARGCGFRTGFIPRPREHGPDQTTDL